MVTSIKILKLMAHIYKQWLAKVSLSPHKKLDLIRLSHGFETEFDTDRFSNGTNEKNRLYIVHI